MKFSDNPTPSLLIVEGTTPANPSAGDQRFFIDSADHLPKLVDSSGTVTPLSTGGVSTLDDLTDVDTTSTPPSDGDVLTYDNGSSLWVPTAPSAGGGITQAYVGYNTIGGSWETPGVNSKAYAKSVTLANACLISSIEAYIQSATGTIHGPIAALYSDNSGAPDKVLAYHSDSSPTMNIASSGPRWIACPLGYWAAAGTYWLVVRTSDSGGSVLAQIAYDGSGSDRTATGANLSWNDWGVYASPATTSNKYSIRANTIR